MPTGRKVKNTYIHIENWVLFFPVWHFKTLAYKIIVWEGSFHWEVFQKKGGEGGKDQEQNHFLRKVKES